MLKRIEWKMKGTGTCFSLNDPNELNASENRLKYLRYNQNLSNKLLNKLNKSFTFRNPQKVPLNLLFPNLWGLYPQVFIWIFTSIWRFKSYASFEGFLKVHEMLHLFTIREGINNTISHLLFLLNIVKDSALENYLWDL